MPRTSFLDLPRELRHQILLQTHDANFLRDAQLLVKEYCFWSSNYHRCRRGVKSWALCLRKVHELIVEDIDFVEMEWNKCLAELWEEGSCGDATPWRLEQERVWVRDEDYFRRICARGFWVAINLGRDKSKSTRFANTDIALLIDTSIVSRLSYQSELEKRAVPFNSLTLPRELRRQYGRRCQLCWKVMGNDSSNR